MADDVPLGRKIDRAYDPTNIPGVSVTPNTLVGIVKDNLSPNRDGRVRVWVPDFGGDQNDPNNWKKVSYASPYFGSTYQPNKDQNNHFTSTNHTYGMWMPPPDIGTWLLCTFINGNPNRGYWFACINPNASGHMVPAIGASSDVDTTFVSDNIKSSVVSDPNRPQYLPVAEFNDNIGSKINGTMNANKKPIHEIQANILFLQGLDGDKSRGAISSSSQRESPSNVFGISTPGRPLTKDPADDPDYASKVASGKIPSDQYHIPTRKGGHTFVMDDGDVKGVDQLIRLRTADGHQILMNDDQSFIYISHKNGTNWIELDDTGIKIYTKGDFSVRSEGTINLHADKDINMQALGSITMDSSDTTTITSSTINIGGAEDTTIYGGKNNIGGGQIIVSSDGKLSVASGGAMKIDGATIDINGGSGGSSISNPVASKGKHADTTYDSQVTRLWSSVPNSVDSVVTVLPSHEPWPRTQTPVPPTKEVASSICAPKTGGGLTSGNGSNVTDGSGNPVNTSSSATVTTDVGIAKAAGLSVVGNTCPAEYLNKKATFNPTGGIGKTAPKFAQNQVKAMMAELGYYESQFNYSMVSEDASRIGKYQVDAAYLVTMGYIKPDAVKQYGALTLSKGESWTGKDDIQSQDDFFNSPNVQDTIQFNEFTNNYSALLSNGGITTNDDICMAAGMLFVAHQFRDVGKALQWRKTGVLSDAYGRNGTDYYNQGRYAIDVLAAGGVVATPVSSASGTGGENTSGLNPDDLFIFQSSGTGTRSNFDQLNGEFKTALCNMAHAYKLIKGGKITITSAYRSPADQDSIYQRWLAAGGGPGHPTAGGITTPAKPISLGGKGSPHNNGVAIDSSQCPIIARTVNLAQYGLRWGGTFTKPDQVHIQMANASQ